MKSFTIFSISLALSISFSLGFAQSPDPEHVTKVEKAQKSAYAVTESTNHCPQVDADLFEWPKQFVLICEYSMPDTALGHSRRAVAYLLDIRPKTIAIWIETACAKLTGIEPTCFEKVLNAGLETSGYMFAISGNIIEDMKKPGAFKNFFFRNGMTTSFKIDINGSDAELSIEDQRTLALLPNDAAITIPSGMIRPWGTTLDQFQDRFPSTVPRIVLNTAKGRQQWLKMAQTEMLSALNSKENRLLEAWLCANTQNLSMSSCTP
ncbi:MAG: hypothetical protein PHY93_13735 [Bacteriovorax sp.]|nr:hypothetical protein [Bacteriovorax sp.]